MRPSIGTARDAGRPPPVGGRRARGASRGAAARGEGSETAHVEQAPPRLRRREGHNQSSLSHRAMQHVRRGDEGQRLAVGGRESALGLAWRRAGRARSRLHAVARRVQLARGDRHLRARACAPRVGSERSRLGWRAAPPVWRRAPDWQRGAACEELPGKRARSLTASTRARSGARGSQVVGTGRQGREVRSADRWHRARAPVAPRGLGPPPSAGYTQCGPP